MSLPLLMLRFQRIIRGSVAILAFGTALATAQTTTTLTLEQAMASAEGVNLTVLLGREAAAQAVEVANATRSNILPNVTASAAQRRTDNVSILGGTAQSGIVGNRFDAKFSGT